MHNFLINANDSWIQSEVSKSFVTGNINKNTKLQSNIQSCLFICTLILEQNVLNQCCNAEVELEVSISLVAFSNKAFCWETCGNFLSKDILLWVGVCNRICLMSFFPKIVDFSWFIQNDMKCNDSTNILFKKISCMRIGAGSCRDQRSQELCIWSKQYVLSSVKFRLSLSDYAHFF